MVQIKPANQTQNVICSIAVRDYKNSVNWCLHKNAFAGVITTLVLT